LKNVAHTQIGLNFDNIHDILIDNLDICEGMNIIPEISDRKELFRIKKYFIKIFFLTNYYLKYFHLKIFTYSIKLDLST